MVVEAVDDRGAILTDAISAGASSDLTKDFTTVNNKNDDIKLVSSLADV